MLEEMSPGEWEEWKIYVERNPLLGVRLDFLFAMLAKTVAEVSGNLDRKAYPNGVPIEKFLPEWGPQKTVELTIDQSVQLVLGLAEMYGAIDLRGAQ